MEIIKIVSNYLVVPQKNNLSCDMFIKIHMFIFKLTEWDINS